LSLLQLCTDTAQAVWFNSIVINIPSVTGRTEFSVDYALRLFPHRDWQYNDQPRKHQHDKATLLSSLF
ncbi:hypothetical protein, partial [Sansalvadorimonas verongulae]|uniref:hypothetical protein n=1 Tax=Sansalvadorimonas verongulae TaxID=2172824 RepID=UPI001E60CB27